MLNSFSKLNKKSMPNPNSSPTQTKIKSKAKSIIGIILGVTILVGVGGILYFSGVIKPPKEGFYSINLSSAFSKLDEKASDPYVYYGREPVGFRLDTERFASQVDKAGHSYFAPFSHPQGTFPPKLLKLENEFFKIDTSNIFLSSSSDSKNEDRLEEKTISFENPEKNKIYTKIGINLKPAFFKKMEEQMKKQGKLEIEGIIKDIKDIKDENKKKEIEAWLKMAKGQIDEGFFQNKEKKEELEQAKKNGMTFYAPLENIISNSLIEVRYQYDPRYFIIRKGQIYPLHPTPKEGVSLRAKISDSLETGEIKVHIPQEGFGEFKAEEFKNNKTKFGVYPAGFLIGKAQSNPILHNEINKILEKNYITKAELKVTTLHHKEGKGEMQIYLSPDGGQTWISPEEWDQPKITLKETKQIKQNYIRQENVFHYKFNKENQPTDLRMIVVAQNITETGVENNKNEAWEKALKEKAFDTLGFLEVSKVKGNKLGEEKFVPQATLFLLPNKEEKLKINGSSLSGFNLISKYGNQANLKIQGDKIKTGSTPFYTQISFIKKEEKPNIQIPFSGGNLDSIKNSIKNIKNQTTELIDQNELILDKSKTGEGITDPAPIEQKISSLEKEVIELKRSLPEGGSVSQKVTELQNQVNDLKDKFTDRKSLDRETLDILNNINQTIDSLNSLLQKQEQESKIRSQKSSPISFNLIPQAKAADGDIQSLKNIPLERTLPGPGFSTIENLVPSSSIFSAVVLPNSTPILSKAEISFETEERPTPPPEESLDIHPSIWYRGAHRVVLKWNFISGVSNNLDPGKVNFKYGESKDSIDKGAKVYKDKKDGKYYVVLRQLKGGQWSDKNDEGFQNGRFPYYYQVSAADKKTEVKMFRTLNRMQTIGYLYTLVHNRDYLKDQSEENLKKWETPDSEFAGKKVKDLEKGGPGFFYKPKDKEPLTLPGIKFTMVNDRLMQEFDKRLLGIEKDQGIKKAVSELYRVIHDRIYDDDLGKFYDQKGLEYWISRTDPKVVGKDAIDIFGVKFALSVSKEYQEKLFFDIGMAEAKPELAYQIVLKRGADQKGAKYLAAHFTFAKEMRKHLAESKEYEDRLKEIEKKFGRKAAISEMYETLYARAPDIKGVEYWDKTGLPLDILKQKFLTSEEFTKAIKE